MTFNKTLLRNIFAAMSIGSNIKKVRTEQGFTQKELSEKSGLSLRTIQRIENDEVRPSIHSLKRLGVVLHQDFKTVKIRHMSNTQKTKWLWSLGSIVTISVLTFYFMTKNNEPTQTEVNILTEVDFYNSKDTKPNSDFDIQELKTESDEINDFVNIDWDEWRELVSMDSDKGFVLRFVYTNKDTVSVTRVKNFDVKFPITKNNFDKDVSYIDGSLKKLVSLHNKYQSL